MAQFVLDVNLQIQKVLGLDGVKAQLSSIAGSAQVNVSAAGVTQTTTALGATQAAAISATKAVAGFTQATGQAGVATGVTSKAVKESAGLFDNYSGRVALAGARYSAFLAATALPFAGLAVIGAATQSIIELDSAMIKLSQILKQPKEDIEALRQEIIRLSLDTGTSITEISAAASTLAQAGFLTGKADFAKFLEPLSKIPLLPTFESVEQATEGVIAALGQFGEAGLEPIEILDKLTRVADNFAVESKDLVTALQIAGGTFSQLGGNIDEFLALFTTIRQTTRESAESIATALKTISTRLAQPSTVTFLESIGVSVRDQKGELLGLLDIFKNLQSVFQASGKEQQALIGTKLGGVRNVGRVFAGLNNTELTQEVLNASQTAAGAVAASAEQALQKVSVQIDLLTAKFVALAQSLAEPVFLPIIQGALTAGNALIFVLDALKPVLPLLVELTALGLGLKVFSFAASSINGLAKALASVNIGGLAGLGGGGFGIGARSAAGAGQNVVPVGGVGARQISGARATATDLAGSQIGQLGGLLALNLVAEKLSGNFEKTDSGLTKLGLETFRTATALTGLASLASGKSVTDLFTTGGFGISGGVLAGGIAAAAAISAVTTQTSIDIDELVKKAARTVNELDISISPGNNKEFQEAIDQISAPIGEAFAGIAKEFDIGTFSGLVRSAADHFKKFFTLDTDALGLNVSDVVSTGGAITEEQVTKFIKEILGTNGAKGAKIVSESLIEFGADFNNGIQKSLEKSFAPLAGLGVNIKNLATGVRDQLIKDSGGLKGLGNIKESADRAAANKLILDSTRKLSDDLRSIIVPQQLGGELQKLSEVVEKTVLSIDNSVSSFQGLAATIGKIETPKLPTTVSEQAVREGIRGGDVNIPDEQFGGLSKIAQQVISVNKAVKDFETGFELALGNVSEELGGAQIDPSVIFDGFVEQFLAGTKDLPPEAAKAIENTGSEIALALKEAFNSDKTGLDAKEIKEIVKRGFGSLTEVSDAVVTETKKLLEANLRLQNVQSSAKDIREGIFQESSRPVTILNQLQANLEALGINAGITGGFIGDASQTLADFGTDTIAAQDVLSLLGPALKDQNDAFIAVNKAVSENSSGLEGSQKAFDEAADKVRIIKAALLELGKAADISVGQIDKRIAEGNTGDPDAFRAQTEDAAASVKELVAQASKLIELNAAEDASRIFVSSQERFSQSVDIFNKDVGTLTQSQIQTLADISSMASVIASGKFVPEAGGQERPDEFAAKIAEMTNAVNQIFQKELAFQTDPRGTSDLLELIRRATAGPPDTEALISTFKQIAQENKSDPSNPLAFLGGSIDEIKKNLQLTLDPATKDQLLINLSPEAREFLNRTLTPGTLQPPTPNDTQIGASTTNLEDLTKISDMFTGAITQLVDTFVAPQTQTEDIAQANATQAAEIAEQNSSFLTTIGDKIAELVAFMQSTAQEEQATPRDEGNETNTEELVASADATNKNTEVLTSATTATSDLSAQLIQTADAIKQGVGIKVDAIQTVNVNVTGVADEIEGVGEKLNLAARDIAKDLINQVLDQLAFSAPDTETSSAFSNARLG